MCVCENVLCEGHHMTDILHACWSHDLVQRRYGFTKFTVSKLYL